MLLAHTTPLTLADQFESHQVYSSDDIPDDHLLEEGRWLTTVSHESGGSQWISRDYAGFPHPIPRGDYPAFCN